MTSLHESVPPVGSKARLDSVDMLRGLVMVLMVLDHTRDFFADTSFDPTDLGRGSPALFLTRWITHFCAPVFAFLAGTGAYLAAARGRTRGDLARFLMSRGLWLIVLEQTVELFGLTFRPLQGVFLGLVLTSIGGSLFVLGLLVGVGVPSRVIAALGVLIVATHNLLDIIPPDRLGALQILVVPWFRPGLVGSPASGPAAFVGYPLIPWLGVVLAGYGFGEILGWESGRRRRAILALGLALAAAFAGLRAAGVYGDPRPWTARPDLLGTILEFVNVTKYPPSLLYLLMTLGPALVVLAAADRGVGLWGRWLVTLGRVPLFYYLLQWYVIHALALLVAVARGQSLAWLFPVRPDLLPTPPPESAYGLPSVYAAWAAVVLILYVASVWFAGVKRRNPQRRWLSYL